jgi:hypothetical protein
MSDSNKTKKNSADVNESNKNRNIPIDVYQRELNDVMHDEAQIDELVEEYAMKLFNNNLRNVTNLKDKIDRSNDYSYFLKNYKRIARLVDSDLMKPDADGVYDLLKKLQRDDNQNMNGTVINDNTLAKLSTMLITLLRQTNDIDNAQKIEALLRIIGKVQQAQASGLNVEDEAYQALLGEGYDAAAIKDKLLDMIGKAEAGQPIENDMLKKITKKSVSSTCHL